MALVGVAIGPTAAPAATGGTAADAAELRALLHEIQGGAAAASPADAAASHADIVTRLGEVQTAVQKCEVFLDRFGSNPEVVRVLSRIRTKPGQSLFTSPEDTRERQRIVGEPIHLGQSDLELCVRLRDGRVGAKPGGEKPATLAAIDASLGKCLSTLNSVGPNPAGLAVLRRVGRGIGDATFTSAATLGALEQAVGRDLRLAPRDLETCADAYDAKGEFIALTAAGVGLGVGFDCQPPGNICVGTDPGDAICCTDPNPVCAQTCDNGEDEVCAPFCEPQACFPGDAVVELEGGATKAMRDVRLGDRVQVARADGSLGYEEVYLNTHKDGSVAAPYVALTLASGRGLTLSPRHFIPVAAAAGTAWDARVNKGADELRAGDLVWSRAGDGGMALDEVAAAETRIAVGAYNPLTLGGTIVVDGVVASAHSDWFLDGVVSADTEAKVYQAVLAPVRAAYRVMGPERMATVTEGWGVVDFVRERSTADRAAGALTLALVGLSVLVGAGALVRRRRAAVR